MKEVSLQGVKKLQTLFGKEDSRVLEDTAKASPAQTPPETDTKGPHM